MLKTRPILITIVTSGLLIATTAGAQGPMPYADGTNATQDRRAHHRPFETFGANPFVRGGARGPAIGSRLALGTTVTVEVFDAEPTEGVEPTETLTLTVGEDSEIAFAEALAAARDGAAFLRIQTGEQTRTIDLPDADEDGAAHVATPVGPRFGQRSTLAPSLAGLETGDVVTAVFYAGDPDAGAAELETMTFVYGESSAIGFQNAFAEAAQDADYVVVTTPPSERVVELTAMAERPLLRDRMLGRR
jgi:hypothetical protein